MWPNIGNSGIDMGEVIIKTSFFEEWSWFKFNDLGLALGIALKFYTSVAKGLKVKVKKFSGLIPMFVEVTGENMVEGAFWAPSILNRVNRSNGLIIKCLIVS